MLYQYATCSRLGNRNANEDRVAVAENGASVLLLLADGLGGHKGGHIAAQTAMRSATHYFHRHTTPIGNIHQFLHNVFMNVQLSILESGHQCDPPIEPKCTLVACLAQDDQATWAHIGDSRLYMIRQRFVLEQTRDHSVVEDLFRQGRISERQKASHPERNRITQCMGSRQKPVSPTISETIPMQKGDGLLLCTDGFWAQLSEEDLRNSFHPENLTGSLEQLAQKAESNFYPNSDNVSAVAFRFVDSGGVSQERFNAHDLELEGFEETLDAVSRYTKK